MLGRRSPSPPEPDPHVVASVGQVVLFKMHRSAHGGKRGIVTKVTTSRPPSVRVRLAGGCTEKLVLASAVQPVRAKSNRNAADMMLMDPEQAGSLHGKFADLRAEARGGALKQNEHFPPSWVTEVHNKAAKMPKAFVARHELEKVLGVPHRGEHGADQEMTPEEMANAMRSLNPRFSKDQLKLMARNQTGGTDLKSGTSGVAPLAMPWSARQDSVESDAGDESEEEMGEGELRLTSTEHVSWQLQRRLKAGQKYDDHMLSEAIKQAESVLSGQRNGEDSLAEKGIKPLVLMSESRYTVIQRDAAVALYSLSINEDNKPKFLKSKALGALVRLAESEDTDIRLNVAGAVYRLSMCEEIKRPFVLEGVLDSVISFLNSPSTHTGQQIQRHAMEALKELVENKENVKHVLDEGEILPPVFDVLAHPDSRVRRLAAWTLETLAKEDSNKIRMLQSGALERIISLCRMKNMEMRRAAASCMAQLTNFSDIIADPELKVSIPLEPTVQNLADAKTIKCLLESIEPDPSWDTDPSVVVSVCEVIQNIVQVLGKGCANRILQFDALPIMLDQAGKLNALDEPNGDSVSALTLLVDTLAILYKNASGKKLRESVVHIGTVLSLCKSTNSRIRRGGARMLGRISTLEESKVAMAQDPNTVPLLLSLFKFDYNTQLTAARTLAELAEAPRNRPMLVDCGCVPLIIEFLAQGDEEMQFELARALADLASAVDNRLAIINCHGAMAELTERITGDDDTGPVETELFRCVANLVAPAGSVVTAENGTVESNVVGEPVEIAEWRKSDDGIAWRNSYNTNELDKIHMRIGDSQLVRVLMAQPHGRKANVTLLAEESIRNLLRISKPDFDFETKRHEIMAQGYHRARVVYGGKKRLEASGWIVSAGPDSSEEEAEEAEDGPNVEIKKGKGLVVFAVETGSSSDGEDWEGGGRMDRTKSYSQGEYGRLLQEQASRLAAQQASTTPPGTPPPRSPNSSAKKLAMMKGSAIDRFFATLEEKKLRFMDLFAMIDVDKSGSVDASELADVFARHELPISSEEIQLILSDLDVDGDGDIDAGEFLSQMRAAQNRRREEAGSLRMNRKPVPPVVRRPATMETVKNRRLVARTRMEGAERERETAREKERRRHEKALRQTLKQKVMVENARMAKAASAVKVQERQLQRVRMTGLAASYGARLTAVLPPIGTRGGTPRGRTPRGGTMRGSGKILAAPMTA